MPSKTILVVDDERDIREGVAMVLEDEGYRVLHAHHGAEALGLLERRLADGQELPGLIVLDLFMPVMDGRQLLAALAESPQLAGLPVLLTTASERQAHPDLLPRVQATLRKPIELGEFLDLVAAHCR